MRIESLTTDSFASILLNDSTRTELLGAMRSETGSCLPLRNHVSNLADCFTTTVSELDQIVDIELSARRQDLLDDLVFHHQISETALWKIYEAGLCLTSLAHRAGPVGLLERVAREHRIEEAVLTLLLDYYATDEYSVSQFMTYVREFQDIHGVRYELQHKSRIPAHKRQQGLEVLNKLST